MISIFIKIQYLIVIVHSQIIIYSSNIFFTSKYHFLLLIAKVSSAFPIYSSQNATQKPPHPRTRQSFFIIIIFFFFIRRMTPPHALYYIYARVASKSFYTLQPLKMHRGTRSRCNFSHPTHSRKLKSWGIIIIIIIAYIRSPSSNREEYFSVYKISVHMNAIIKLFASLRQKVIFAIFILYILWQKTLIHDGIGGAGGWQIQAIFAYKSAAIIVVKRLAVIALFAGLFIITACMVQLHNKQQQQQQMLSLSLLYIFGV